MGPVLLDGAHVERFTCQKPKPRFVWADPEADGRGGGGGGGGSVGRPTPKSVANPPSAEPEVPAAGSVPPYLVCQRASGTGQREGQRSGDRARDLKGRTYSRFRQQIVPSIGCWFWHDPPVGR